MKKLVTTFLAAAFGVGMAVAAQAAEPIKIGSVLSVTGPAALLGDPELKTLELYVDKINKDGGVLGRPLKLVHYDDGGAANKAVGFFKRLIDDDKVDILVGGTLTGVTMAVIPMVEHAQIPFISLAGAGVIVEPVKKWVFKTPHTDGMAAERALRDMAKNGITQIALLSDTGGFGQSARKEAKKYAEKLGIKILADETYGPKDTDMTAQLTKIKGAAHVQAIFVAGFGQGPAIVNKNIKQLGITMKVYHFHGVASKEFIELSGGAAEGVRLPAAALIVASQLPANDPQKPVDEAYIKAYTARYHEPVSTFGGHAYDALMIAVNAIKKAGSTDKAKVRDAIEQTKNYVGVDGVYNMSPTNHLGLDLGAFRMVEVKNGDWKLID